MRREVQVHNGLRRVLWAGLVLAGVLSVAGILWLWLHAAGDRGAADGVRGVLAVTLAALALDLVAAVVLLAFAELRRPSALPRGETGRTEEEHS